MIPHSRQERERERRRQQILAASKRVFSTKGFHRATVKDIAGEAELSPGTIYIYFRNKDELYAGLSIRMLKHLNLRLQRVRENKELGPHQRLEAVKKAFCEVFEIDPPMFITLLNLQASETLDNISADLLQQIAELTQKALGVLQDIFAQTVPKEHLVDSTPAQLALVLWGLFSGLVLWEESKRRLDPRKDYLQPTLDIAFEIFERGALRPSAS